LIGHLGVVSNAAVAVNRDAHREPPSVPSVLSRGFGGHLGMHREDRSCISPVTLRECKLRRRKTRRGKTERWRSASRPAMRAYDGSPVGVSPVTLRNADVNELVSLNPTSSPISVTDSLRAANRLLARSMRRLVRKRYGVVSNDCLNTREKWYGLSCTSSAKDDTHTSSAR